MSGSIIVIPKWVSNTSYNGMDFLNDLEPHEHVYGLLLPSPTAEDGYIFILGYKGNNRS